LNTLSFSAHNLHTYYLLYLFGGFLFWDTVYNRYYGVQIPGSTQAYYTATPAK